MVAEASALARGVPPQKQTEETSDNLARNWSPAGKAVSAKGRSQPQNVFTQPCYGKRNRWLKLPVVTFSVPGVISRCGRGGPLRFGICNLRLGSRHLPLADYCAGMVIKGNFSELPVSARVKKNMTAVRARFVCQSLFSIQNQ